VPLMLSGDERVVQYYVPYLSALQLYTARQPNSQVCFRYRGGSESDTGSEASSDGESDCKGAESPPPHLGGSSGNSSMLECKIEEKRVVWSYFEKSPPYCRVPLVDKIADLSRDFEADPEHNPLRTRKSFDLLPNSWFSVAWYPIYRIPTGPTLRDLAACFLTFHSLSTSLPAGDGSWRQSSASDVGAPATRPPLDVQPLKAFGLASYKLRGAVWSSNPEKRLAAKLEHSAYEHLTNLGVRHPDFDYFTSHTVPIRR
jgi:hypothetical protein